MARPAPTHRELGTNRLVHAAQWHRPGDRPEGLPDCSEADPFLRAALTPEPVVRAFSFALLRPDSALPLHLSPHARDACRHADVDGDAFIRNCTTPMREHGWLASPSDGPGVGYILCPGSWLVTHPDGHRLAELPGWFEQRYQPL